MKLLSHTASPPSGSRTARSTAALVALLAVAALAAGPAVGLAGAADADPGVDAAAASDANPQAQLAGGNETAQLADDENESDRFDLDADVVEQCGLNCRTVTANLTNTGDDEARNVTANVSIHAEDTEVWTENYTLGNVSAGDSVERTENVSIGPRDYFAIERNDGEVTMNVTVAWDDGNQTFSERRQVL